ncbi:unnamed protein product [Clavelina lepadiformis]|uniref:Fibrinogen C-terminal domain-containing protein n=1 Tax=Clavelina lepadiformis TaxID=159417 RepID=A0ABP0GJZ5_CLALP
MVFCVVASNDLLIKKFDGLERSNQSVNMNTVCLNSLNREIKQLASGEQVFQRRIDGSVDFQRNWRDYSDGFGLSKINKLTRCGNCRLRVDLWDFDGVFNFANYSTFRVENEAKLFRLEVAGYRGNATSKLINHNGMPFTTYDEDNDNNDEFNCATRYGYEWGGWWFNNCWFAVMGNGGGGLVSDWPKPSLTV